MVGEHKLIVESRRVRYEITIRHKLNLIMGDSGTGKTLMCKLLQEWYILKDAGGTPIRVKSDLRVIDVLSLEGLRDAIKNGYQLIVIDEINFRGMSAGDAGESIASLVKDKPVYCIFITRDRGKTCLPIDVYACYKFSNFQKGSKLVIKNEQLYYWSDTDTLRPKYVYTEDTCVDKSFFSKTLPNAEVRGVGGYW